MPSSSNRIRVLAIYGSESGTAKRGLDRLVKKWANEPDRRFDVLDMVTGNVLAKMLGRDGLATAQSLEELPMKYDVLLVATSSYGDGDPPSNMHNLTKLLQHEASMRSDALTGMQHAVLGFGSTTYTTFMNIPRLTDKFLGECGSRRLAQRAEIDEHDPNPGSEPEYKRWGEEVFRALQALPLATEKPACDWTSPASKISNLNGEEDEDEEMKILGQPVANVIFAVFMAIVAFVVWYLRHRQ